jgi:hypothetical protein
MNRDTIAILIAEIAKSYNANICAINIYQIKSEEPENPGMGKKSEK